MRCEYLFEMPDNKAVRVGNKRKLKDNVAPQWIILQKNAKCFFIGACHCVNTPVQYTAFNTSLKILIFR